jgi:hypothetical protein
MTYLLVCALCTGSPGQLASLEGAAPDAPGLTLDLRSDASPVGAGRDVSALGFGPSAPVPLVDHSGSDGHSGHDGGGSHMGPMWIVMGAMMVGMMVALGVYMMRGNAAGLAQPGALSSPQAAAIPVMPAFRPGG